MAPPRSLQAYDACRMIRCEQIKGRSAGTKNAIRLDAIKREAQARAATSPEAIVEYADDMREGQRFPPIIVFFDGSSYWLADGFHRVAAAELAGLEEIDAQIEYGALRDALKYACGANQGYGVRRTNADERQAVKLLLLHEEWREWSNREIARYCGVDEGLVGKVWEELSADNPQMKRDERAGKRGGKVSKWRMPSQPAGSKPRKRAPPTPELPAKRDGFEALQTAWQRASQVERKRFVVWARGDDLGAFEDTSAPAADYIPRDTDALAIAPAPASDQNAPQPEPTLEEIEPAPANGGTTPPPLSPNEIDSMGIDALLRFVRDHDIDIPGFEHLPKLRQQAALKDYMARAGAERRNAA